MGNLKEHPPVKYFTAIALNDPQQLDRVVNALEPVLGLAEQHTAFFLVNDFTSYYTTEMGPEIHKCFIAFKGLQSVEGLPKIKCLTNELESTLAQDGQRTVNIDPGYLTLAKMVLATTKDYSHRLYLGQGIFGDLHLTYSKGSYQACSWTYPDYLQPLALNFFNNLRSAMQTELQSG